MNAAVLMSGSQCLTALFITKLSRPLSGFGMGPYKSLIKVAKELQSFQN